MSDEKEKYYIKPYILSSKYRYIIVDENGYDVNGEHYTLEEAKLEIKYLTNETN